MEFDQEEMLLEEQEEGRCPRLAAYRGQSVTLVDYPDKEQSKIKAFCEKHELDEYLGEYPDPSTERTYLVYDIGFNVSCTEFQELETLVSYQLKKRIGYEIVNLSNKLCVRGIRYVLSSSNVVLDFGIRVKLCLASLPSPVSESPALDLEEYLPSDSRYCSDYFRSTLQNPWNDLDKEADALNMAYFWSGYKGKAHENWDALVVRELLFRSFMKSDEEAGSMLFTRVSRLEDCPVKFLFMGIILLQGFGCIPDLEMAEANLDLVYQHVDKGTRMGMLTDFLKANLHVQKGLTLSRERMLSLANKGNPFAQVYISRVFARLPLLGRDGGFQADELSLFEKLGRTGYGVSLSLAPLYSTLVRNRRQLDMSFRQNARRSAESGNALGRILCLLLRVTNEDVKLDASELALAGSLAYLTDDVERATFCLEELGAGIAFLNMERSRENHPEEAVSWLTCMDLCRETDDDDLWFQLISDRVTEARLWYSLIAFGLDEHGVLSSIDFTKRRSVELVFEASRFMETPASEQFMQRVQDRYLDAFGLRALAGLYRKCNQRDAALQCYLKAGTEKESSEAKLDVAVMFLEEGKSGKAHSWGDKAGFPYDMLVSGLIDDVDRSRAVTCFELAAHAGDPCGMWMLGVMRLSKEWLKEAASLGFSEAFKSLGQMSKYDRDVEGFWRYRTGVLEANRLSRSFTLRDPVSDAAIVAVFNRRWETLF